MAVQTSYPGVYVQEVPSGVRTITGVSTSVTAFLGEAKRGPINKAVQIFSFADFERRFGGLSKGKELGYAARQFFLNGGTQAIIVRLAQNAMPASVSLLDATSSAALLITAKDQGSDGNNIEVRINWATALPDSTFNLLINYTSKDNPSDSRTEFFSNLSMNSQHARYVEAIVEQGSNLVTVTRQTTVGTLAGLSSGTASSGVLADVAGLIDATHDTFRVAVNGLDPVAVRPPAPVGGSVAARLANLCTSIQTLVRAQAAGQAPLAGFTCAPNAGNDRIVMTSGQAGENSRVELLPGLSNDVSARLKLTVEIGGTQQDAVHAIRPVEAPARPNFTTGNVVEADITGAPPLPDATARQFRLSIDGGVPDLIDLTTIALTAGAGIASHNTRMTEIAVFIQTAVRKLRPGSPAYSGFTCTVANGTNAATDRVLIFSPGTRGSTASIVPSPEGADNLATRLHLLLTSGAVTTLATDVVLSGGTEPPITNPYAVYTGDRAPRTGMFALEAMDIFNIMCLPGVQDGGILMEAEAYCRERRAFLIADAPTTATDPAQMAVTVAGAALPKSDHAAVYFPWLRISDPLNGGALRNAPPSGTLAGLFARTDSNRGVWKAPAGTEASLIGVRGLTYPLTDRENGLLNPLGVNCLRAFPDSGAVSWGARTLKGADSAASEWKYIPVRRTALFIEESLYRGLKWVVFEPNDEPLWAQIRLNVGAFMHNLFRQGAFQGQQPRDAYFVRCDKETTTQNDINLGIVNVWVGFAPLKPAEFVVLYLQQMTGQIQV